MLFILFFVFGSAVKAGSGLSCQNLFRSGDDLEAELMADDDPSFRDFPNFLNVFRGLPINSSKIKRALDSTDHQMMAQSYLNLDRGQPRETGKVKLLDSEGNILAESGIILGRTGQISMNENIFFLLNQNLHFAQDIAKVEITHTHPTALRRSSVENRNLGANHSEFSSGDFVEDRKVLEFLKSRPIFRHIYVESYILFNSKGLIFNSATLGPDSFEGRLGIKGYQIK